MIFDPKIGALYGNDGVFIKNVQCPKALTVKDLMDLPEGSPDKYCDSCMTNILCINNVTEEELRHQLNDDPDLCIFASASAKNIVVLHYPLPEAPPGITTIKTARSIEAMQDGFSKGFRPLVKIVRSVTTDIGSKLKVLQHQETGELWVSYDYRHHEPRDIYMRSDGMVVNRWMLVADWVKARPDYPFPLAAYLIPKGLQAGERLFLDDLIEDIGIPDSGQGDSYRLASAFAVWDGIDFNIEVPRIFPPLG